MDRLNSLATAFLDIEDVDDSAALAIGSFAIFDGPTPDFEDFLHAIEGRLPLIPRYRQRVRRVAFDLAAPVWEDDPEFDIRWHVRSTALPTPGGRTEIGNLLSRVMTRRMDRSRPLWEYWFVEGVEGGRWALLSKLHHSMVDGVSGTDLYQLILDPTPTPRGAEPDHWRPAEPVGALAFNAQAAKEVAARPVQAVRDASRALTRPARFARTALASAQGMLNIAGAARPVHHSSLTGPLDGSRRYTWSDVTLSDIRIVRKAFGVTVNDVALAAVTGGLRRLLLSRGEIPDPHAIRSLVPVSTRAPGEESIPDNRVSLLLPYLPVEVEDPVARLEEVRRRIRQLRAVHEVEGGNSITSLAAYPPFAPVSLGIRLGFRLPQRWIATVTTNVPGPRQTLYALGREVQEMLPYVPIADRVRIGIAMFSYRDVLTFGITGDYDTAPDLDVLATGISESLRELVVEAETEPEQGPD